ncbi:18382_t:CDS:1, partial [Rhizophagus irregularis]
TPRLLLPISFGTIQFLSIAIYAKLNKFIQHSNLDLLSMLMKKMTSTKTKEWINYNPVSRPTFQKLSKLISYQTKSLIETLPTDDNFTKKLSSSHHRTYL